MKGLSPPTQRSKLGCCHFRRQNEPTELRCWFAPDPRQWIPVCPLENSFGRLILPRVSCSHFGLQKLDPRLSIATIKYYVLDLGSCSTRNPKAIIGYYYYYSVPRQRLVCEWCRKLARLKLCCKPKPLLTKSRPSVTVSGQKGGSLNAVAHH